MWREEQNSSGKSTIANEEYSKEVQGTFNNLMFILKPAANWSTVDGHGPSESTWELALHLGLLSAEKECDLQKIHPIDHGEMEVYGKYLWIPEELLGWHWHTRQS